MPIYEYVCVKCKERFEDFQVRSGEAAAAPRCPFCRARKVERVISAGSFQLKGTGWYATDYKSPARGKGTGEGAGKEKKGSEAA